MKTAVSKPTASPWIEIRKSSIHHRGAYAIKHIPEGTKIIEYVGRKIGKDEADMVYEQSRQAHRDDPLSEGAVYIFILDKKWDIDGNVEWNTARHINHSCDPNCETDVINRRIWIIANRDIEAGEELTYDYGYDFKDWEDHPCRCGSDKCIGYIASLEEHEKLSRILKRRGEVPPGSWWSSRLVKKKADSMASGSEFV